MVGFLMWNSASQIDENRRPVRRSGRGEKRRRGRLPQLETLELRINLSTIQWTGAGSARHGMTAHNRSSDVGPQPGTHLIVPAIAKSHQAVKNLPAGTSVGSITSDDSSHTGAFAGLGSSAHAAIDAISDPTSMLPTTTTLSSSNTVTLFGQIITLTALVTPVSTEVGIPTGTVALMVNGTQIRSAPVDPTTGEATFRTLAAPFGNLTVTAVYSGDSNFASSEATITLAPLSLVGTQTVVTTRPVRNRSGRPIAIDLDARVLAESPGSGVPVGSVTYFLNGNAFKTKSLSDGEAVLSVKPIRAAGKYLFVNYGGDSDFQPSFSSAQIITARFPRNSAQSVAALKTAGELTVKSPGRSHHRFK
jgi:hypothetical protein